MLSFFSLANLTSYCQVFLSLISQANFTYTVCCCGCYKSSLHKKDSSPLVCVYFDVKVVSQFSDILCG